MKKILIALPISLLAACGGGGSSGSTPTPTPIPSVTTFPVDGAFTNALTKGLSYTMTAKDTANNSYSLTFSYAPGQPKTNTLIYPTALPTTTQTVLISKNGVASGNSSSDTYYSTGPLKLYGYASATFSATQTSQSLLPATATLGSIGSFYTATTNQQIPVQFATSSGTSIVTQSAVWSLEQNTASLAWLCINTTSTPTSYPNNHQTEKDCYQIDAAGNVSGMKIDLTTYAGVTLQFR